MGVTALLTLPSCSGQAVTSSQALGRHSNIALQYEHIDNARYRCGVVVFDVCGPVSIRFPEGTSEPFYDVVAVVIALVVWDKRLNSVPRTISSAIKKLLGLQAKTARVIRDGKEMDLPLKKFWSAT